mmetsp:Transcript_12231/g.28341  ORF Transcript_12231/g.28341 Transcript_12231/m.28341 type:complete len:115 (+) Transcript_12231:223-567(+)
MFLKVRYKYTEVLLQNRIKQGQCTQFHCNDEEGGHYCTNLHAKLNPPSKPFDEVWEQKFLDRGPRNNAFHFRAVLKFTLIDRLRQKSNRRPNHPNRESLLDIAEAPPISMNWLH